MTEGRGSEWCIFRLHCSSRDALQLEKTEAKKQKASKLRTHLHAQPLETTVRVRKCVANTENITNNWKCFHRTLKSAEHGFNVLVVAMVYDSLLKPGLCIIHLCLCIWVFMTAVNLNYWAHVCWQMACNHIRPSDQALLDQKYPRYRLQWHWNNELQC